MNTVIASPTFKCRRAWQSKSITDYSDSDDQQSNLSRDGSSNRPNNNQEDTNHPNNQEDTNRSNKEDTNFLAPAVLRDGGEATGGYTRFYISTP
jgi:hypothetical protein